MSFYIKVNKELNKKKDGQLWKGKSWEDLFRQRQAAPLSHIQTVGKHKTFFSLWWGVYLLVFLPFQAWRRFFRPTFYRKYRLSGSRWWDMKFRCQLGRFEWAKIPNVIDKKENCIWYCFQVNNCNYSDFPLYNSHTLYF